MIYIYISQLYNTYYISKYNSLIPGGSDGKLSACNAGDPGLIPGSGRSSGEGNGNPLQYSCLENLMDGAWSPWGRKESDTTERLHFTSLHFTIFVIIISSILYYQAYDI